jgi:Helix-hairpin-helix domain
MSDQSSKKRAFCSAFIHHFNQGVISASSDAGVTSTTSANETDDNTNGTTVEGNKEEYGDNKHTITSGTTETVTSSSSTAASIKLSVLVWGEITFGTLKSWSTIFPKLFPLVSISKDYSSSTTHIIVDSRCDHDKLCNYIKSKTIPDNLHLLSPAWVIASLKSKSFQPITTQYLYPHKVSSSSSNDSAPLLVTSPLKAISSVSTSLPNLPNQDHIKSTKSSAGYMCQQPLLQPTCNLNKHITDPLEKLLSHYELQRDNFRAKAYKIAINKLKKLDFIVRDVAEVSGLSPLRLL